MGLFKRIIFLLLFLVSPTILASTLELSGDHGKQYVVKKGDTLWDIAGHFLKEPWRWPEIWNNNRQIENPNLIYPGDIVFLSFKDGKPVLQVRRGGATATRAGGRPVVKLSPEIRSEMRQVAIPSIPLDVITPFLSGTRVINGGQIDSAPYVVSTGRERLASSTGGKIFVRGLNQDGGIKYSIYRKGQPYIDPESGDELGYEGIFVGQAQVDSFGDPATLIITNSVREVLNGDRLIVEDDSSFAGSFIPSQPDKTINGSIISVVDGVSQIGRNDIVVLNVGSEEGIAVGDVLGVYQKGGVIYDKYAKQEPFPHGGASEQPFPHGIDSDLDLFVDGIKRYFNQNEGEEVTLPDEKAGVLMIFRTFDQVSFGLVMESYKDIHVSDRVSSH